jgi:SAM-dependent methyltransferase
VLARIDQPDRFERRAGITEQDYRREWRKCGTCGAAIDVHLSPMASRLEKWATDYYEVEEESEDITGKFARVMALPHDLSDNRLRVRRVHEFATRWRRVLGQPATEPRVLDVGAGIGVFLSALCDLDASWKAVAVEPAEAACRHLRSLESFEVVQGLFDGQPDYREFDLLTFNKVIEHIRKPQPTLMAAKKAVSDSGLVYVEVPHMLSVECCPPDHFILGALHHHLYSPASLSRLLESTGWTPLESGTVFEPSGKISAYAFCCLPETAAQLGRERI